MQLRHAKSLSYGNIVYTKGLVFRLRKFAGKSSHDKLLSVRATVREFFPRSQVTLTQKPEPTKQSIEMNVPESKPDDGRIPAQIFQTWKTKDNLPQNFATWSGTFKDKNPHFQYVIWDDDDNRDFIRQRFPWFLRTYDSYPLEIFRADAVRYFYLYTFGGIYADIDTECLKPLDDLLSTSDVLLARMGSDPNFPHSIPNAIMASRPRQEFWLLVIGLLSPLAQWNGVPEAMTGPILLKAAVELYSCRDAAWVRSIIENVRSRLFDHQRAMTKTSDIRILGSRQWYPLDWSDPVHSLICQEIREGRLLDCEKKAKLFRDSWMVTYWSHSWASS